MSTENHELCTMKAASEQTGFAKSTIHRWVKDGKIKNHQTDQSPTSEILISVSELQLFVQEQGIKNRPKMQTQHTAKPYTANSPGSLQTLQRARERYIDKLEDIAGRLEEEIKLIDQKKVELAKIREEIERVKKTLG